MWVSLIEQQKLEPRKVRHRKRADKNCPRGRNRVRAEQELPSSKKPPPLAGL